MLSWVYGKVENVTTVYKQQIAGVSWSDLNLSGLFGLNKFNNQDGSWENEIS